MAKQELITGIKPQEGLVQVNGKWVAGSAKQIEQFILTKEPVPYTTVATPEKINYQNAPKSIKSYFEPGEDTAPISTWTIDVNAEEGGGASESQIKRFAEEQGMSEKAAKETLERYAQSPLSDEFKPLSRQERQSLQRAVTPEMVMGRPEGTVEVGIQKKGGEFVSKEEFEKLEKEAPLLATRLKEYGIDAYNEAAAEAGKRVGELSASRQADLEKNNVAVKNREGQTLYIPKEQFESLPSEYREIAKTKSLEDMVDKINADHIKLADGKYIPVSEWNALWEGMSEDKAGRYQHIGITQGYDKMTQAMMSDYTKLPDGALIEKEKLESIKETSPVLYNTLIFDGYKAYSDKIDKLTSELSGYMVEPISAEKAEPIPTAVAVGGGATEQRTWNQLKVGEPTLDILKITKDNKLEQLRPIMDIDSTRIAQLKEIEPYIKKEPGIQQLYSIDLPKAVSEQRVRESTLEELFDLSKDDIKDIKWAADFEKANYPEKMRMSFEKDPVGTAKAFGIGLLPVAGTAYYWKESPMWLNALFAISDIAILVPVVGQVSAAVKGGMSIPRAVLRASAVTARGTVTAPYNLLAHPVAVGKSLLSPLETLVKLRHLPIASLWRGSYAEMDLAKVLAGTGKEARATRDAMAEAITRMVNEGKSGKYPIADIGTLEYSGAGIQKVFPKTVVSASPYGDAFKGKGLVAEGEGLWVSPDGYYGLSGASASGKQQLYAFQGKNLVGVLGDTNQVLNDHGKVIGRIRDGTKIIGIDGKTLGTVKGTQVFREQLIFILARFE